MACNKPEVDEDEVLFMVDAQVTYFTIQTSSNIRMQTPMLVGEWIKRLKTIAGFSDSAVLPVVSDQTEELADCTMVLYKANTWATFVIH